LASAWAPIAPPSKAIHNCLPHQSEGNRQLLEHVHHAVIQLLEDKLGGIEAGGSGSHDAYPLGGLGTLDHLQSGGTRVEATSPDVK